MSRTELLAFGHLGKCRKLAFWHCHRFWLASDLVFAIGETRRCTGNTVSGNEVGNYRDSGQKFTGTGAAFGPAITGTGAGLPEQTSRNLSLFRKTTLWYLTNINSKNQSVRLFVEGNGTDTQDRHEDLLPWEGRDELNLAEFPIACLSHARTRRSRRSNSRTESGTAVAAPGRRAGLTISASEKYGLPTSLDDEVILGLIQLTRETNFESRHVFFSRYQLIRLLGWRNEGKSYTRLETSLKRWIGVSFYYEKAWWDKAKQSWVDESFHILERVSLFDRRMKEARAQDNEPALSMFCWNEVVFRSFQSGYLKSIDMELFRRLQSPVAKRLYRLLDKRFYHKKRWEFDLRELACEHVGLSRSYDMAGLKRKLHPAVAELESVGYLKSMDPEKRFARVARGRWRVHFQRRTGRRDRLKHGSTTADMETALIARGVNPVTAAQLATDYSADTIRKHVEALDWRLTHDQRQSPRSPAGFLVQSIRNGYAIPDDLSGRTRPPSAPSGSRQNCGGHTADGEEAMSRVLLGTPRSNATSSRSRRSNEGGSKRRRSPRPIRSWPPLTAGQSPMDRRCLSISTAI